MADRATPRRWRHYRRRARGRRRSTRTCTGSAGKPPEFRCSRGKFVFLRRNSSLSTAFNHLPEPVKMDCRALVFRGFAAAVAPYALLSTSSCPLVVRAAAAVPVARANPVHAEALVARVSAVPAALAATAIPVARALHAFNVQFLSHGAAAAAHA
ncbi:hypothetical protein SAY86_007206 [Trapa natans]|uniref:Uncharacterized protein n=1 Tax=Trapa natans TaxID=22666 RepID=A0AAN7LAF9_TRANT|nr:hypothetical protein SAY86_007206 [Trapa natans]